MRYLLLFTVGFTGGCALSAYSKELSLFGAIAAGILFIFFGILGRKQTSGKKYTLIFLGAVLGLLWFGVWQQTVLKPLRPLQDQVRQETVTLTEYPRPMARGSSADGYLVLDGKTYQVRTQFSEQPDYGPGDQIRGPFRITLTTGPDAPIPGYHCGRGIFLLLRQCGDVSLTRGNPDSLRYLPARLRQDTVETLEACFAPREGAFARALFLGDSDQLDFETDWNLQTTGIRHMVAVSGLHISILCVLVMVLTFHNRYLTAAVGIPVLILFAAVTGFSPSVTRACIMMTLMLLGAVLKRPYDGLTGLSLAVLLMLLHNPLTVTSLSFQLSVGSVLGILLFNGPILNILIRHIPPVKKRLNQILHWICSGISISLSSLVVVTPLTALRFGTVSLIAPITNLLTIWLIPALFWGILFVLVLGSVSLGAAEILAGLVSLGIRYVLKIADLLAAFPLAALYTRALPMLFWIGSVYLLAWVFLRGTEPRLWHFVSTAAFGLFLAICLSWGIPRLDAVRMTTLDIGQGQCILLQTEGRNYMVDCGGSRDEMAALEAGQTLRSQGIFRLDGLILTHMDRDHVGGAPYLLNMVKADAVYLPTDCPIPPDPRITVVEDETKLSFGNAELTIYAGKEGAEGNEKSLAVLLDCPEYDILITGDRSEVGELDLLQNHRIPKVDCLVAGHHGAENSTSELLLNRVRPDTVVISAGAGNLYGHPAGETLRRLQDYGCQILRTDLMGTILIRR